MERRQQLLTSRKWKTNRQVVTDQAYSRKWKPKTANRRKNKTAFREPQKDSVI